MTDSTYFEVYRDKRDEYRWRLIQDDVIYAVSNRGYADESTCRRAVHRFRVAVYPSGGRYDPASSGDNTGFDVYVDAAGDVRWRFVHNGNIIAVSPRGYESHTALTTDAAPVLRRDARYAPVRDQPGE